MKIYRYSQACKKGPLQWFLERGRFGLVAVLQNTFIKQPLKKKSPFPADF